MEGTRAARTGSQLGAREVGPLQVLALVARSNREGGGHLP